jgi:hypothetical protein
MDAILSTRIDEVGTGLVSHGRSAASWGAIIAGAFVAAAVSLFSLSLGAGLGLASVSPWTGRGLSATKFAITTAVWLIVMQWVSAETVAKDTATAEQKAANEVAKSENSAAKDLNGAAGKIDDKVVAFNNTAARDAYDLSIAKADADRKVALAACESASGDAQKKCKGQAEADYSAAKANAKAAAQAEKQ